MKLAPRYLLFFALVILGSGVIEMATVMLRTDSPGSLIEALGPTAFRMNITALCLSILRLSAQPGTARGLRSLVATAAVCAVACSIFLLWASDLATGYIMSRDTLAMLIGNPVRSVRHLLQTDIALSMVLLAALAGLCTMIIKLSQRFMRTADRANARLDVHVAISLTAALVAQMLLAPITGEVQAATYSTSIDEAGPWEDGAPAECRELQMLQPANGVVMAGSDIPRRPVIVLLVESLRGDLLTAYPEAAPYLSEFARENVVFDKAYATSSHSDYTDLAFWYSRYPLRFPGRTDYPADASWRGLSAFEYFKKQGYSTAYFSSQNERWGDMINWLKLPEVDTFFHSEDFSGKTWENEDDDNGLIRLIRQGIAQAGKVEDTQTLEVARGWIGQHAAQPFFVGLNLQNTHYSYVMPAGADEPFQPSDLQFKRVYGSWPRKNAGNVRNRYLNAVWNVDKALAAFVADLKRMGVWDRSIVLIVGDNGEAFYEHDYGNHSGPMYEEVARTLVLAKLPQEFANPGTRVLDPISHIDVIPLIVAAAGLPPWEGFQGANPFQQTGSRQVFMTVNAIAKENGVVAWPWKLLRRELPSRSVELFNLASDPQEKDNVAALHREVAQRLTTSINHWKSCQFAYYADPRLHGSFHPPRYDDLGR